MADGEVPQTDLFLSDEERSRQKATPLMRQYWKIKDRHPGALLLFRMGDFYETFEQDAKTIADLLGITLTTRGNGAADDVPLAGFPHHALEQHLPKLVQAGHRVAVCEQLEDPKYARKIVKRGVVEVVTPGVTFRDQLLAPKHATYLAAIHFGSGRDKGAVGVAFADASTGEFYVAETDAAGLGHFLQTVSPAEVLIDKRERGRLDRFRISGRLPFALTPQEDWVFGKDFADETLLRHFKTHSLKGFGVEDLTLGRVAAGAALYYLGETQKGRLPHLRRIRRYRSEAYVALDAATRRNLELTATLQDGSRDGSLIGLLDETLTPMGGRLLRRRLVRPLRDVRPIRERHDAVEAFVQSGRLRADVREALGPVTDLERLAGKACTGRATPRDLAALRRTLEEVPTFTDLLADETAAQIVRFREALDPCEELTGHLARALTDDPPAKMDGGGYIRDGYDDELDDLRHTARSGKEFLDDLRDREAERTGIPSLKVGVNKVFGYYLEVTHTHADKVPDNYIRKQTLTNSERYITPELKAFEEKILTAEEKMEEVELRLFQALREEVAEAVEALQTNAHALAALDVFAALAEGAQRHSYVRPQIDDSTVLEIEGGRHPVVEQALAAGEAFVPNDVRIASGASEMADEAGQIHLITGPNMSGKSVVLRQTGLIVLLAQVGAFVPAERARVGVVDALFTRVGASDNLAAGESTFLVEMNETANILNNATARSLILLDEVGRGTSTFDGLSIAWAIVEHLHEIERVAARTLFATHYHELNALAARLDRVRSFRVQVQEHEDRVIFLHRLAPGAADHSYGIEVARMAGLPRGVVQRARKVLAHLETQDVAGEVQSASDEAASGEVSGDGMPQASSPRVEALPEPSETPPQPAVDPALERLRDRLRSLDPDHMTPVEALMALSDLKRELG